MNPWKQVLVAVGLILVAGCSNDDDTDHVVLTGTQLGALSVDLASGAVAVTAQPQGMSLKASAVVDDPADTVTVSLTVKNHSSTTLSNLKAVVTGLSEGSVTGDGGVTPTPDGGTLPYVSFGPASLKPDGAATRDIVIDGVLGGSPELTLDLELRHSGWFFSVGPRDFITGADSAGTGDTLVLDVAALGPYGDATGLRPMAASANGRFAFFACRNQPAVARLDLATFAMTFTKSLMGGNVTHDGSGAPGSVASLTPSPDGKHLYAVVNEGAHVTHVSGSYFPPTIAVVRLDAQSLGSGPRVEVFPSTYLPGGGFVSYRGRRLTLSADGTRGALAVTELGLVYLLDLAAMELIDVDDVTPGTQGFDVSTVSNQPRFAAISPDASEIYVAFNASEVADDGTLWVIDVATGALSPLAPATLSAGTSNPTQLEFGPDGRLYYARNFDGAVPGLSIYDPVGATWVELLSDCNGVWFGDGEYCAFDAFNLSVHCFDSATDAELAAPGSGLLGVSLLDASGESHGLVKTGE